MTKSGLIFQDAVTLAGGGVLELKALDRALQIAPNLVAADGAADRLMALGRRPKAVIGDMDSLIDPLGWQSSAVEMVHLSEQDTTDFEKCLYSTDAPGYVGVGFTGRRTDHTLAVFHAMLLRAKRPVVLLGTEDAIAVIPESGLEMSLQAGARVSLFPLVPVTGRVSEGLRWSIAGWTMETGGRIGTSNIVEQSRVRIQFDRRGALILLEPKYGPDLFAALAAKV